MLRFGQCGQRQTPRAMANQALGMPRVGRCGRRLPPRDMAVEQHPCCGARLQLGCAKVVNPTRAADLAFGFGGAVCVKVQGRIVGYQSGSWMVRFKTVWATSDSTRRLKPPHRKLYRTKSCPTRPSSQDVSAIQRGQIFHSDAFQDAASAKISGKGSMFPKASQRGT